jgi:hypothetical protein
MFRRLRELDRDTSVVAANRVQPPREPPPQAAWVACEFEMTGLHPGYIGAGDIHGRYRRDLIDALRFEQLLGCMLAALHGRALLSGFWLWRRPSVLS